MLVKNKFNNLMALWYLHPRIAILFSLIVVNLIIIFLFTAILSIVSGSGFLGELAYIFTFTMSADGIYDFVNSQDDLVCFVIKIFLALIQMVIFSGALIGFSTDFLQTSIDNRLNNTGSINLSNHMVFLNWSDIGANIIYDLSFLDGAKNIVILCEDDKDEVLTSIQNIFIENNKKMRNIRIFVKYGSPSSLKHLREISLGRAKYIALLLSNHAVEEVSSMSARDLNAFKSMLNLVSVSSHANIVVETEAVEAADKMIKLLDSIDEKLKQRIIVFSRNGLIGRILGRTIINSTYSPLYHYLLSYDGCEFYGIETMDVEEALYTYNDCIPIINYDDDDIVDENGNKATDQLYIFSDDKDSLGVRSERKSFVVPLKYRDISRKESFSVFAFSDDSIPEYIVSELQKYQSLFGNSIMLYPYTYDVDISDVIRDIEACQGKKKIVFLSSNCSRNKDADIFITALKFKLEMKKLEGIEMISEISNQTNLNPLQNIGVMSVIVSKKIISLFMLQLLTHPRSKKFYLDVISTNGAGEDDLVDLDIVRAEELLEFDNDVMTFKCKSEFVQSFYLSSSKKRMCIGIKSVDGDYSFLCDRMDEETEIVLRRDDELILVNYC